MASTYSGNLAIELIGTGDQAGTWGATTNTNLGTALEQAITASSSVTFVASGNSAIALTQTNAFQAARSLRLTLTGTATISPYLFIPAINKEYIIYNGLANTAIVSNGSNGAATGATVSIPAGRSAVVYNDATNITESTSYLGNVSLAYVPSANIANATIVTANVTTLNLTTPLSLAAGGTASNSAPYALATLMGFTTTATANGNTVLTSASSYYQVFTGTANQNVALPVVSTLANGWSYHIANNSTGNLVITSSGLNTIITVPPGITTMATVISTSGTDATSWEAGLTDFSTSTGTGSVVLSQGPTIGNATINAYTESVLVVGNTGTTQTVNIANATVITATLTGSCTWTMPTATAGKSFTLLLKTGSGSFTSTWTGVRWNNGNTAPTMTATASRMDIYTFVADGTVWYGSYSQNYVP